MATAGNSKGRAWFAAACGVLSRYVKQQAAAETEARSVALPLMPGADLTQEEQQPTAQMTIFYGGRVLVLDDVPADKAAGLLQLIAAAVPGPGAKTAVARKASLQRFMEKRKARVAARAAPYLRPDDDDGACSACPDHLALVL